MSYQSRFLVAYLERELAKLDEVPAHLPLTRGQRLALFEGLTPRLTFDASQPSPVKAGHIERLSGNVRIEVHDVKRTKKGDLWRVDYTLFNDNLGQRFIAKQAGQAHPQQYVSSPAASIDDEAGQAVDHFTQKRITRESRERNREAIGEMLAAMEEVRAVLEQRIRDNPDSAKIIGRELWQLRGRIDACKARLKRQMAA